MSEATDSPEYITWRGGFDEGYRVRDRETRDELQSLRERALRAEQERDELLAAARAAIPEAEHPKHPSTHNWAWQLRVLGDDRRAAYRQRDAARADVARLHIKLGELRRAHDPYAAEGS